MDIAEEYSSSLRNSIGNRESVDSIAYGITHHRLISHLGGNQKRTLAIYLNEVIQGEVTKAGQEIAEGPHKAIHNLDYLSRLARSLQPHIPEVNLLPDYTAAIVILGGAVPISPDGQGDGKNHIPQRYVNREQPKPTKPSKVSNI